MDVGYCQVDDCLFKIVDFVGGFWCVDYLNKIDCVDGDVGVILGDNFL